MKRKSRNKFSSKKPDLLKPINMDIIGNDNDPCFGKHHDPTHKICNKCGDAELCAIMVSQKLHVKRAAIESKQEFKDVPVDKPLNTKIKRSEVSRAMKRVLLTKQNPMSMEMLSSYVPKELNISEDKFNKMFKKVLIKNKRFQYNKGMNNVTYKK